MAMTSVNVSLPDPLKAYVDDRVATGEFGTPAEFIRSLIRQDKEQRRARLEAELLEALQSKEIAVTPEELARGSISAILRDKIECR
jgi:antitoxin ParD1/3/4